jgi:4-amino-4-deoxy-L-arabinose transferase-like glycosyltransferase
MFSGRAAVLQTGRLRRRLNRWIADRRAPLVLLGIVCVLGTGARAFHLGIPAASGAAKGYIFDESYYVSAARVIAGEPATAGDVYAGAAPAGADPNGEHPQLGKLIIAASIGLLGDNAIGWRITAVLFGAAAILLLYWLVRCAGGSAWLALGAASLASVDNLWLVHSRIAVLDIYVVPFMLAGAAFYLRRHPIVAGVLIGIGSCVKEFAAYAVFVLLFFELMRALRGWLLRRSGARTDSLRAMLRPLARPIVVALVAGVSYFSLLAALDSMTTPYSGGHPVDRNQASVCRYLLIWGDACNHFAFMNHYAAKLSNGGRPRGIAALPVQFWLNRKAITYYKVTRTVRVNGAARSTATLIWFRGEISRVLLVTAWFAILLGIWWAIREKDDMSFLVLAWILGTWLPPELFSLIGGRTTYLYYMVVTMPALYIAVARLLGRRELPRWLLVIWIGLLLVDAASLYPFRTLSGG